MYGSSYNFLFYVQKEFHIEGEEGYPSMMSELGAKLTTNHSVSCDDMMTVVHPSRGMYKLYMGTCIQGACFSLNQEDVCHLFFITI